jgi:RNA recognition motif-containing protein
MNKFNIYVGNVATNVTEEQLKSLFEQYGEVIAVKMIKDRFTGEARGFAFVEMASSEEGQQAIEKLNGAEVGGRRLRINEARPQERNNDRPRRPFGNGGGSSNGGGSRFGGPRYN